ncbi:MAG: hypothetical protein M1337_05640 [Actinobacteria bacterium]|nr:hypothetical protein [Actinomycetota bacterium]
MREPTIARDRERGATGIVDTLSMGYVTVNRHPWIIAIPVLLDLLFWLGPRLSLAPLIQQVFASLPASTGLPADLAQNYQDYRQALVQTGEGFNLFSLLAINYPGIPSLMASRDGIGPVSQLASAREVLGLSLLIPLVGVGLASLYYVLVGREVRGGGAGELWGRIWRTWLRVLGFLLLAMVAMAVVGVPVMVVTLLVASANTDVLGMVAAFVFVAGMWVQFYLFFVVDAIVISDAGPLRAIRNSLRVVRYNLGSSLGLVVLIWVITWGMTIVWDAMANNPIGAVAAILGNAYISTGLAVASLAFYRERFAAISVGDRGQGTGTRGR